MNREHKQFFALLRAGLWNTPVDATLFAGSTNWEAILAQATRQTVSGLVAQAVSTLPAYAQPPAPIADKMRSITIATIRSHALLNRTLAEAVDLFRRNGIRAILFKGQGVAANYPEPTLRICGDIDLYVGHEQYEKACALARQWGEAEDTATESEKHYHFRHGSVTVELHRIAEQLPLPWHNARFQRWTQRHLQGDGLRSISVERTMVLLPPVNFDALYIFNHAWHHFAEGGGVGLRQLCDWVRYLHTFRDEIDHAELERDLKAFRLWQQWRIFGCIAVELLGLPRTAFPFYTDRYATEAAKVIGMIEEGGNFGFFDAARTERPQGYIAGKMHSLRRMSSRFGKLAAVTPQETVAAWVRYLYTGIKQVIIDTFTSKKKQ